MSDTAAPTKSGANWWREIDLRAWTPFVALAVLLLLGFFVSGRFLTIDNITNVVTRSAFVAIVAIGATFVITAGGLDLSVGSMGGLISGVTILFLNGAAFGDGYAQLGAGMLLAVVLGIPFSILASANICPQWVVQPVRRLMDACRAINEIVFALMFVVAVGLGPFAGVMALAVPPMIVKSWFRW